MFEMLGIERAWYSSALGAHLTWTRVRAVDHARGVQPLQPGLRGAARDLRRERLAVGAPRHRTDHSAEPRRRRAVRFTLSYDEIARTSQSVGALNTLPLELEAMQTNATTPVIYALGAATTGLSLVVIGAALVAVTIVRRRRGPARIGRRQSGVRRRCV